jgi:hypothetical protein
VHDPAALVVLFTQRRAGLGGKPFRIIVGRSQLAPLMSLLEYPQGEGGNPHGRHRLPERMRNIPEIACNNQAHGEKNLRSHHLLRAADHFFATLA